MNLGELIRRLEELPADQVVPNGFDHPHSYRGYYDELAFQPATGVTVGSMLADARSAVGATYTGWKGGDYIMDEYTPVHLAWKGSTGDELNEWVFDAMTAVAPDPELERLRSDVVDAAVAYHWSEVAGNVTDVPRKQLRDAFDAAVNAYRWKVGLSGCFEAVTDD